MEEEEEKCGNCHSYSGSKIGRGWCMKRRQGTKANKWCGLHN